MRMSKKLNTNCLTIFFLTPIVALVGCAPPSLLITPVSSQRALQETLLSRDSFFAHDKIAVIDVSGVIQNSPRAQLFGSGEHPVSLLLEQLQKARKDSAVKAVILRINSPGGTVVASELMHDEIMHFRKSGKPIVAVMMDVAASGGYYIACACDEIVAQRSTVTGSIGVVMQLFNVSGTMELIGITSDAITSGINKDTGSPFRKMKPEERQIFKQIVMDMYERFVAVVVAGRKNIDEQTIRRLADGRVYSAGQALENGLIDRIATMREVIASTKKQVGSEKIRLVTYQRSAEYKPNYYATTPSRPTGDVNLFNVNLPSDLTFPRTQFMYLWSPGK